MLKGSKKKGPRLQPNADTAGPHDSLRVQVVLRKSQLAKARRAALTRHTTLSGLFRMLVDELKEK